METNLAGKVDAAKDEAVNADRRRPGRRNDVNPTLIGLLRAKGGAGVDPPEEASVDLLESMDEAGPLSVPRGVAVAVLLSSIVWALSAVGAWLLFRAPKPPG